MDKKIRDRIVQTRVQFLFDQPFFGNLALRLKLVEVTEDWLPTMAVDGVHMYYHPDFVAALSDSELQFVVAHEIMHCVYEHFMRRDDRQARLWNCAGDYVINLELSDLKVGTMPPLSKMPGFAEAMANKEIDTSKMKPTDPGGLIDEKFRDMPTEKVYDIILEDAQKGGKHANDMVTSWDIHLEPDDGKGGEKGDKDGQKGRITLSKEELDRLSDEIKKAVMDAAKAAEDSPNKSAGNLPGGVKRLIEKWTDSKMNWRELLNARIQSTLKSDYTWQRSSRKGRDMGIYLPGMDNDFMVRVHVCIDTSGSITAAEIADFLSEVKGIMEQFADFEIAVWCFDTATYTIHTYTPDTIDEIYNFVPEGGGGTDFMANWNMMEEEDIQPAQLVMFTDGYPCGSWGNPDYCDTLFVVKGNKNAKAPFGTLVHYEDAEG